MKTPCIRFILKNMVTENLATKQMKPFYVVSEREIKNGKYTVREYINYYGEDFLHRTFVTKDINDLMRIRQDYWDKAIGECQKKLDEDFKEEVETALDEEIMNCIIKIENETLRERLIGGLFSRTKVNLFMEIKNLDKENKKTANKEEK